jgi:hypothetical protein
VEKRIHRPFHPDRSHDREVREDPERRPSSLADDGHFLDHCWRVMTAVAMHQMDEDVSFEKLE